MRNDKLRLKLVNLGNFLHKKKKIEKKITKRGVGTPKPLSESDMLYPNLNSL